MTMLDAKVAKSRLHLDFRPDNQAAEVDRLLGLGAHRVDIGQGEQPWAAQPSPTKRDMTPVLARLC